MERFIFNIHSFVDVITNSSTELFVCDTEKTVEVVLSLLKEIEDKYPNEYGHELSVNSINKDDYRISEIFNFYGDDEDAVNYLKARGYEVNKPKVISASTYIEISAERGGLDFRVKKFIEDNFNVVHYNFES